MILNRVIFAGQVIITILHKGLDNQVDPKRNLNIKEKIGRYNLSFEESIVSDNFINKIDNVAFIEKGGLIPQHELNPYNLSACAFMTRYVSNIKPSKIIKTCDDKFEFKISSKELLRINSFIKKYTGLNLNYNPILYGDTLLYEHTYVKINSNETNGISLGNIEKSSILIVKFKNKDIIVSSKVTVIDNDTTEIEINSPADWQSVDIEVYRNDDLVYFNYDVSFIKRINLSMNLVDKPKRIKLNQLDDFFELKSNSVVGKSIIGEDIDELEELFSKSNFQMRKKLLDEQEKENITFIRPGETQKSIEIISEYIQKSQEELWIFDPYFTDKIRFKKSLDWLRIINGCSTSYPINIVFFCKDEEKAYDFNTIKEAIEKDSILTEIIENSMLNINFIQIRSPIHDRFIIGKNDNGYSGLTIGTSLNSIDNNHFCISVLNHSAAKKVLTELTEYINETNIIGNCKV
ncbi:TPA: hypothetical protein ACHVJ3_001577 [Bacillus cereus]|uniref:hypothetical protein n=1 Tax=Bacillus cereus TaxID=1396 RepID=UPI0002D303DA|nr:hypothetical protein [Bacillus cereus]MCU4761819.1 hypothetical protein [Bacillus cereus]QOW26139.1 hypothetical protein B5E40_13720 [Bacillus cereus]